METDNHAWLITKRYSVRLRDALPICKRFDVLSGTVAQDYRNIESPTRFPRGNGLWALPRCTMCGDGRAVDNHAVGAMDLPV